MACIACVVARMSAGMSIAVRGPCALLFAVAICLVQAGCYDPKPLKDEGSTSDSDSGDASESSTSSESAGDTTSEAESSELGESESSESTAGPETGDDTLPDFICDSGDSIPGDQFCDRNQDCEDGSRLNVSATIAAGADVELRMQCSDGSGPGDLVECGLDDVSICPQ